MIPALPYWVTDRLAIVPRPFGDDYLNAELTAFRSAGIDVLVSALQPAEAAELGLADERTAAEAAGLTYISFPIPDGGVPEDTADFAKLLDRLQTMMTSGSRIGVHCRGCIGRSSVITVCLLGRDHVELNHAWQMVRTARGCDVPDTPAQKKWIDRYLRGTP